jgi:uncharacterized protein
LKALIVTPDGTLSSCIESFDKDLPFADSFSIGKIDCYGIFLDGKKMEKLRSMSVYSLEKCADCFCKWHCAGDCMQKNSAAYTKKTDKYFPTDRCYLNQELSKILILDKIKKNGGFLWKG